MNTSNRNSIMHPSWDWRVIIFIYHTAVKPVRFLNWIIFNIILQLESYSLAIGSHQRFVVGNSPSWWWKTCYKCIIQFIIHLRQRYFKLFFHRLKRDGHHEFSSIFLVWEMVDFRRRERYQRGIRIYSKGHRSEISWPSRTLLPKNQSMNWNNFINLVKLLKYLIDYYWLLR